MVEQLSVHQLTSQKTTQHPEALDAGTVVAFGSSTVAWEQADDNASSTQSYDISGVQKATNGYEAVGVVSTKQESPSVEILQTVFLLRLRDVFL